MRNKYLVKGFAILTVALMCLAGCGVSAENTDTTSEPDTNVIGSDIDSAEPTDEASSETETAPVESIAEPEGAPLNTYGTLSVPTCITKIDGLYFIVDCYHNQVIYHKNLTDPLTEWHVMTDAIDKGHTVASDGVVYLVDDTEAHRILVFEKTEECFVQTQVFESVGQRPHYIVYDEEQECFYVWSSMTGEMFLYKRDAQDNQVSLWKTFSVPSLDQIYTRTFTILEDMILFPSANGKITCVDKETLDILAVYTVPGELGGMIQIEEIQDYYYMTVSTDVNGNTDCATIVRFCSFEDLAEGYYEDLYDSFVRGGTPYFLIKTGEGFYMTEHRMDGKYGIWHFDVDNNELINIRSIY